MTYCHANWPWIHTQTNRSVLAVRSLFRCYCCTTTTDSGITDRHRLSVCLAGWLAASQTVIMRPSSVGGGRIFRCTLSVRLSVCLSVSLSVCPSVPLLLTLEHRSRVFVNHADVRYLLFCLHVRAAYSMAISAA